MKVHFCLTANGTSSPISTWQNSVTTGFWLSASVYLEETVIFAFLHAEKQHVIRVRIRVRVSFRVLVLRLAVMVSVGIAERDRHVPMRAIPFFNMTPYGWDFFLTGTPERFSEGFNSRREVFLKGIIQNFNFWRVKTSRINRVRVGGLGGGGTPLQEANGVVPLDGVAFSRLGWL